MYYAHSGELKNNVAPQTYEGHVRGVYDRVAASIRLFPEGHLLRRSLLVGSLFHDLGKLDKSAQDILRLPDHSGQKMINHVDAGVSWCLSQYDKTGDESMVYAAWLIHAHHRGLNDRGVMVGDHVKGFTSSFEIKDAFRDIGIRDHVDSDIERIEGIHLDIFGAEVHDALAQPCTRKRVRASDMRMALSLLVDADHADTAANYGTVEKARVGLRAGERLESLRCYVDGLRRKCAGNSGGAVVAMRNKLFEACDTFDVTRGSFFTVPAATGSGKTVSLMNLALRIAEAKGRERVLYIVPFTNIIDQSVKTYRNALVLDGEDEREVVNEIHSKCEYESWMERKYSQLWRSPINASTSVQFFESLTSNKTSRLRKLREFANSVVILDEYHTALPHHMWKVALEILRDMSENYGIDVVFGSGTYVSYWDIFEFNTDEYEVQDVVSDDLFDELREYEAKRVECREIGTLCDDDDLVKVINAQVRGEDGGLTKNTLVIMNTVANAVHLASRFRRETDWKVYHLSSCLAPSDREVILDAIKSSMDQKTMVVATSVIECGIDLSFEVGFRERGSLLSDIQSAGRINRNKEYESGVLYSFAFDPGWLKDEGNDYTANHGLKNSIDCRTGVEIKCENCTAVIEDEIQGVQKKVDFTELEKSMSFKTMREEFRVIDSPTINVIVNPGIVQQVKDSNYVPSYALARASVSIYPDKLNAGRAFEGAVKYIIDDEPYNNDRGDKDMLYWSEEYDPDFYGIYAVFQ